MKATSHSAVWGQVERHGRALTGCQPCLRASCLRCLSCSRVFCHSRGPVPYCLLPKHVLNVLTSCTRACWVLCCALQRPTPGRPFIAGLLDPCTNSKVSCWGCDLLAILMRPVNTRSIQSVALLQGGILGRIGVAGRWAGGLGAGKACRVEAAGLTGFGACTMHQSDVMCRRCTDGVTPANHHPLPPPTTFTAHPPIQFHPPTTKRMAAPRLQVAPNIPAEVVYDKYDNGLKTSNSWRGFYVVSATLLHKGQCITHITAGGQRLC